MADTLRIVTCNIRNGRAFDGMDSWPFRRRHRGRLLWDRTRTYRPPGHRVPRM